MGDDLPALLVITTVHHADDTRIREKLIRSLAGVAHITYATRAPHPANRDGICEWIELRGGRLRRNWAAARLVFSGRFTAAVVHDPELLPAAILAGGIGRRRIIADIHEHVPAQLRTKSWLPRWLRRPAAGLAGLILRVAERTCVITLAEPGYRVLFREPHPVFANYPDELPGSAPADGSIVYVGDVTEERGLTDLIAAVETLPNAPTVRVIGRCRPDLADRLRVRSGIEVLGRLPHPEAMELMRHATVGVAPLRDLPNYRYSLPTKVIEYLGAGIAVVASDLPGTSEVIGGRPGVRLVPPGDISALAAALSQSLEDSGLRRAAAANAAATRQEFRWPHEQVVAFYRRVLDG
jgi:glycosyltransferase involved in cell wall biosynthesis